MPKRILTLTDMQVRTAKPQEKERKLFDGGGLFLLVTPSGGKLWKLKYRHEGKERKLSLGAYPAITLADARQRRDDARKLLAHGADPSDTKKAQKAADELDANTFEVLTREWHERFRAQWSEQHAKQIMVRLEQYAFPFIGTRPIAELRAPDMLAVLRRIETRTLETAHRIKYACSQVFRYAIATGRADRDPTADLRGALPPVKNNHMAAPTDPKEVAPLLRAIDGFEGSFVVKCAMQLAPLLFVRPGELRHAEWSEIDLDAAEWRIPGAKMKMGVDHLVPLSVQSVALLQHLHPLTGQSRYVFPCNRSPLRCMSENTVNAGLRRMGYDRTEITGHGFRAMARTILDEVLGFRPDIIEHQLAHAVKDPLGRAYNRTSFLPERKKMMQSWADYLDGLKG